jgi:hypothetical protein
VQCYNLWGFFSFFYSYFGFCFGQAFDKEFGFGTKEFDARKYDLVLYGLNSCGAMFFDKRIIKF